MSTYYTKKSSHNLRKKTKKIARISAIFLFFGGIGALLYIFFPLISWQLYFAPVLASNEFQTPIPKTTIVSSTIGSLLADATQGGSIDYTDAENWFPTYKFSNAHAQSNIPTYTLSIPILGIKNAIVSTTDNDLEKHLVNYMGTAIPPQKGNSVVFGHSTLPQLFNPTDYKAIFATAYKLKMGDEIVITVNSVSYTYKVQTISIVAPTDTSIFTQSYDDSYVTLVTCTPPGTTWKRLIIRSKLQTL